MKSLFASGLVLMTGIALAAEIIVPQVETVTAEGGQRRLNVSYRLDKPAVVTFDIITNGAPVSAALLGSAQGDVFRLLPAGNHAFTWKVYKTLPADVTVENAKVRVKAWSLGQPPDYMVIDLRTANGEIRYYDAAEQLPGGVGAADYKSAKLVMRKIPAAFAWTKHGKDGVKTGNSDTRHSVLLTSDYYIGVYEYTVAQNEAVVSGEVITDHRPRRGSFNAWVTYVSALANKTGLDFRLPTATEWEFACRAGTDADLYTGENLTDTTQSPNLDALAWYGYNSGNPAGTLSNVAMHEVGLKQPNGFGLYDMLGNIWEFSHDNDGFRLDEEYVDPDPGISDTNVWAGRHGGAFDSKAERCCVTGFVANRKNYSNDTQQGVNGSCNNNQGGRVCLPCRAVR